LLRILGIDPGSLSTGIGIVDFKGQQPAYVYHERVKLKASLDFSTRVEILHLELKKVIEEYNPGLSAIEKAFVSVNPSSALKLGQVRGGVMLSCRLMGLQTVEVAPREVKLSLTGYGAAEKTQVAEMVKRILGVKGKLSFDESDALAIAICAGFHVTSRVGKLSSPASQEIVYD
jgi:crossover junction endodeoxyribonuclease RuvC